MTAPAAATGGARSASPGPSPFKTIWDLLTNVKFALLLVGTALVASMLGVVIPQLPPPMRSNPAARDAWLELQRSDFGVLTTPMYRTGLFDVFHSPWFSGLWVVIIVAVTVCTVSRLRPTIRSVQRPPLRVPDRYFQSAHYRATANIAVPPSAVADRLRAKRYRVVETHSEDGATYLFADRFPWTSYGTFLSHLALLMLLVGGLMTVLVGFDRTLALAETTTAVPVFDEPGPGQIFVKMVDAVRGIDDEGNVIDFRSHLEVTRGSETISCTTTVNDPCSAFGYRLHQAAFFDDVARLRIEGPGGQLLYDDILDFDGETAVVPSFRVTDSSGAVLFDEDLPQMGIDTGSSPGREDDLALARLAVATRSGEGAVASFVVSWRPVAGEYIVAIAGPGLDPTRIQPGGTVESSGLRITLDGLASIPARQVTDLPGSPDGVAIFQMPSGPGGVPYLYVTGVDPVGAVLAPGEEFVNTGNFSYFFSGRVEAAGINIRRDPGDTFIWLAVGMAMLGLGITFYVPRRRLWAKVTPNRVLFAGIAERTTRFDRELRKMSDELEASPPTTR
ncbi:MAG: cytochrome c biogenesis protein ResB [Dehalococcoidia bacterium]